MENTIVNNKPYSLKTWHLFILICIAFGINTWLTQNFVMTREVYHNLLSERMEAYRIDDYLHFIKKISIWTYIILPAVIWIQITFVTLLIQFPLVLKFIEVPFKRIFKIVTYAHIPIVIQNITKTIWLIQLKLYQITKEKLSFVPLAISNLIDTSLYSQNVVGLLSNFNVFQILWCIIIARGLASTGKVKKIDAALLVLIIWIVLLVFQWALLMYLTKVNS
ncbi:MAG: hypothetical protein R6V04_09380 [bacterium]